MRYRVVRSAPRRTFPPHFDVDWRPAARGAPRGGSGAWRRACTSVDRRTTEDHYPLTEVRLESCRQTLLEAAGLGAVGGPAFHHHSPGVDVAVSLARAVRA